MEDNLGSAPVAPIAQENTKKKTLILTILLIVVAVCGLGFGGFELWQNSQKNDEIKVLRAENEQNEEQINTIMKNYEEISDEEGNSSIENKNVGTEENQTVDSTEGIDMAITGMGEVCVVNKNAGKIISCSNDLVDTMDHFESCDTGTKDSEILVCTASTYEGKMIKFVYNYQENALTHN